MLILNPREFLARAGASQKNVWPLTTQLEKNHRPVFCSEFEIFSLSWAGELSLPSVGSPQMNSPEAFQILPLHARSNQRKKRNEYCGKLDALRRRGCIQPARTAIRQPFVKQIAFLKVTHRSFKALVPGSSPGRPSVPMV